MARLIWRIHYRTIMKDDSTHYDTLFDRSLSKNKDENNTMYFEIERQISSPRVKRLQHSGTM